MPTAANKPRQLGLDYLLGSAHRSRYSVQQAAAALGTSRQSVLALVESGELTAIIHDKIRGDGSRGKTIIPRESLQDYLARHANDDDELRLQRLVCFMRTLSRKDLVHLLAEVTRLIERQS